MKDNSKQFDLTNKKHWYKVFLEYMSEIINLMVVNKR